MLFNHARIYSKKHVARDPKLVAFEAETLKNEILQSADVKISPEKAELLAYKCIACLDFDNQAAMSVPMDVRAELIVKSLLECNEQKDKQVTATSDVEVTVKKEEKYFVATDIKSGVSSQGLSRKEALYQLAEALDLYYESI